MTGCEHGQLACRLGSIVLALSMWSCAPAPDDRSAAAPRPSSTALAPCPADRGAHLRNAECGSIAVFEDRAAGKGRRIDIHFARFRTAASGATRALFMLAGGPGGASTSLGDASGWASPLRATLDIVLVDQRGTGRSHPLACPRDIEARPDAAFGHIFDPDVIRSCRETHEPDTDVRHYTTANAADDLDDVRRALGYETIAVYGGSYGTRLAQAYMRRHPARTSAVVLDGVMPFDASVPLTYAATAQAALDRALAEPAERAAFARLIDRFRRGAVATFVKPADRARVPVTMSLGDFGYAVRGMMYSGATARRMPDLLSRAAATGDASEFAQAYWERAVRLNTALATGLHLSVLCAEDVPFINEADVAPRTAQTFLGTYIIEEYRKACALWPTTKVDPAARGPVTASVPTLLLSGFFDPVTPDAFADQVARTLSNSQHLVAPEAGHGSAAGCPRASALFVLQQRTLAGMPNQCR